MRAQLLAVCLIFAAIGAALGQIIIDDPAAASGTIGSKAVLLAAPIAAEFPEWTAHAASMRLS
jgi:hypothetical protein